MCDGWAHRMVVGVCDGWCMGGYGTLPLNGCRCQLLQCIWRGWSQYTSCGLCSGRLLGQRERHQPSIGTDTEREGGDCNCVSRVSVRLEGKGNGNACIHA